ncbi:WD40 repeat-like protein [Aulographum hederae CBS 113979]|uniref:WD40 repeat-like protein n=1 Tax=Aulographum hederae CBS 113979 TaxID=1176131 RepID=A0A6G1GPX0_9PEZI|nr:WD40 repeat-like protein [Aulographum hederae CBS 113979]
MTSSTPGASSPPSYDPDIDSIEQQFSIYGPDDTDDDDMDYEEAAEEAAIEDDNDDGYSDADFHDADEGAGIDIEFEIAPDEEEGDGDEPATNEAGETPRRTVYLRPDQILRILGRGGFAQLFGRNATRFGEEEDEDEIEVYGASRRPNLRSRRSPPPGRSAFEKVPSEVGRQLMESGLFGSNERPEDSIRRKKKIAYRLMRRELGQGDYGRQKAESRLLAQDFIPDTAADTIIHYNRRCYSGQFSNDGNFFYSCTQDFKIHMYDTSNPYNWRHYKTVDFPVGGWTITDGSLSPDNSFLVCSSIRNIVCLSRTDPADESSPDFLDFAITGPSARRNRYHSFGIWSVRFSGDGREIVAGTGDSSVYVFDIERGHSILQIPGHENDVNAVCYGDPNSPHILYSGSDDTTLKVWDRRSLSGGRAAGVFLGHTEGLTYVDSKGDGRYVLSNAKDQTAKLWDLRKVVATEKADSLPLHRYTTNFEYRSEAYDSAMYRPHPHDCSLVTFRGHRVLRTLIRCHFSPEGSSDGRYIYSGSHDGCVYVYNLDATIAKKINVLKATKNSRPRDPDLEMGFDNYFGGGGTNWQTVVRDASWHPHAPVIAASAWNGWGANLGTCTVHTYNDDASEDEADEPPMGRRVDAKLRADPSLYHPVPRMRSGRAARLAAMMREEDEEVEL